MNEESVPGEAGTPIVSVEEAPASPDGATDKGPITVLETCEQERQLIALVRKYPALYDGRHPRFHDDAYKEQLWKQITGKLHIELTQCLVTWSELRYRYQRHVRRLRTFHRSAAQRKVPNRRRPCLRHEEELLFLYPHVARLPLLTLEESDGEGEGDGTPEVEIVEPPPVDIIDLDLMEDASTFRCSSAERRLIEAVSAYPQLYDSQHPQFSNFRNRGLIWSAISNELRDKATKLIKSWLKLQTRFEWEVRQNELQQSELCQLMAFMRAHVLLLPGTVCQVSKYLAKNTFHEPIENFRSVLALINSIRTLPELVQLTEDSARMRTKPPNYDGMWVKVGKAVGVAYERCEVTWLILRSFHTELTAMREAGYQLQDKWYFENVLSGIVRLAATRAAKRANNKRPHNDKEPGEVSQTPTPPATATLPEPPRLPIAIVYPPKKKKKCNIPSSSSSSSASISANTATTSASTSAEGSAKTLPSSTLPEIPLTSFVIPTAAGTVRVSAMYRPPAKLPSTNPAQPAKTNPPNAMQLLPQNPGLQISLRNKSNPTVVPIPITLPTAMIRPIALPPLPPPATAVPAVTVPRNGPSSSSILIRKVQPAAAPAAPAATLPNVAKLLTKQQEITPPPMVRIHQQGEWCNDVGTALYSPVLTPAAALAARELAALTDRVTGRGKATAGGEAGAAAGAAGGTTEAAGTAGGKEAAGTSRGKEAGAGVGAGSGAAAGGKVGAAIAYPEVATTSAGLRASPKAPQNVIIRAIGTSLLQVIAPAITASQKNIRNPPQATAETPVAPPETTTATTVTRASATVNRAASPVPRAASPRAASPVPIAASPAVTAASPAHPVTTASPPVALDEAPSTSKSIPTDFGQSPRGIFMNAINVNLVQSPSAGNSLRIWGGGLTCNYHLNMVRTATLIREVMAVPHLHNKSPQMKAQADEFWQVISQKFHMPEVALRACWNFLANNMSLFPSIAPMSELMRPLKGNLKVWEKSNRLFGKFDEIALKYNWMRHREVIPDLIRHFRQHEHLYWEMRKPRPGEAALSPRLYTERERQEVWREAKINFPDLNHHDIWSMFKFAFRTYMEDLERGIENPWPQNWWQALEQLKFLADMRYHPLEPYYYIVHNKILEEVKRCSMFEALAGNDSSDKGKTSALLARVSKEPLPWCSEEAKRLLTGKLSSFGKGSNASVSSQALETTAVPVGDSEDNNMEEPELLGPRADEEPEEPQPSHSRSLVKRPASGSRPSFNMPTIEAFELTRMLCLYPHTFQRVHTLNKRTAWVRVSKELKITVTECRFGLQYALREMRLLKALDPKNLCTMNHQYYRHMDEIYKQVKNKSTLTVRTPEQMNESVAEEAQTPRELMPQKFIPEINMSTCKPSLVLKNWSHAIGNLPVESQDVLAIKLKYLFAKYAQMSSHNKS